MVKRDKQQFREVMKLIRDQIPEDVRRRKSEAIAAHLAGADWYAQAEEILVYAAIRSEVDLSAFFSRAWNDGKRLFFPKVTGEDMEFYRVDRGEQLSPGKFQVPEPVTDEMPAAVALTPILVPGLVFSRGGARMGYGGGYYDRYLSRHEGLLPVGICFEEQLVDFVPAENHDRVMKWIVTEQGVVCRRI